MNVGIRLAVVIGFIALCCVGLVIANRLPEGKVEQTLPSPLYSPDDVQYFPGPEFKLQREAAAMKAYKNELEAREAGRQKADQTLPSAYYIQDDIQYFPPGPEFKQQREAAALQAQKNDLDAQRVRR